ncbi:hypothetical protein [Nocardia sp. NBC_01009]|nr:hypothetical protein OHA42_38675 [Nocardia sp. NBC_01009]
MNSTEQASPHPHPATTNGIMPVMTRGFDYAFRAAVCRKVFAEEHAISA